jgi:SAM-dependent methyltransferase
MTNKISTYYYNSKKIRKENFIKATLLLPYKAIRYLYIKAEIKYGKLTIKNFYRKISKSSIFFADVELRMCSLFPQKIIDKIIEIYNPKSVLDLGCGVGKSLDYFKSKNIEIIGVEGSTLAISQALNPNSIKKYNLNKELNLNLKFDLIWSFEFVEHIHPDYVENLLKTFSHHSSVIILSAAPPGQGGEGHFNEQLPSYWIEKFKNIGFIYNSENSDILHSLNDLFCENMLVFEKKKNV